MCVRSPTKSLSGRQLTLTIFTTWGDPHYVGLSAVELYDMQGELIALADVKAQVRAEPADVNVLPGYGSDPRVVANLFDGALASIRSGAGKRGRPAKDDGQRPKKGGRPPKWALSEGQKPPAGGDDAPKGKGTHSRRPKKAEGAKKPRGAPTSEYHGVSAAPSKKNPWQARATNPVSLGGDGKYKSIGLFPSEKEAAMAVDDYLYKTFPEKYAAFRANFPRNADGTCDVSGVPGPPPGGPPL